MNKYLPQLLLVLMVTFAWVAGIGSATSEAETTEEIEKQIAEAEELGIQKTTLELYDKMISANPDDIAWMVRKADAYYAMGYKNSYIETCEKIVSAFPDDQTGYVKLMSYYSETGNIDALFKVHNRASEEIQANEDVARLFGDHEYDFKIVSGEYEFAGQYEGDRAVVVRDGFAGYVDASGSITIECDFDEARPFVEERAAVKKDGEWFLIDQEGDRIAASHDNIQDLCSPSEGLAAACVDGKWGYYDEELKNAEHFEYEGATSFFNGVAAVKQGGKWGLINSSFESISGFDYDDVAVDFANVSTRHGSLLAKTADIWHVYDLEGNQLGSGSFEDVKPSAGDYIAVKQGGKWGFAEADGDLAIECEYDNAESFSMGIGSVVRGSSCAFVDHSGDIVVEPDFHDATPLSSRGVTAVHYGDTMRYVQFSKFAVE